MSPLRFFLTPPLFFLAAAACGQPARLTGSTPCDSAVRAGLMISAAAPCDFIRWQLDLGPEEREAGPFVLEVRYGAARPNTTGFTGGQLLSFRGRFTLDAAGGKGPGVRIYRLQNEGGRPALHLAQLDGQLFHLMDSARRLLVGNGGWSYTLVREGTPPLSSPSFPAFAALARTDTAREWVYDGRTPCREIARQMGLEVRSDCFKLKWRLRLRRDPDGGQPAGFSLSWTLERPKEITGTWRIQSGPPSDPSAVVYRLDFDDRRPPLRFRAAGDHLLFFLDPEGGLLKGNRDFTYTLNRKP